MFPPELYLLVLELLSRRDDTASGALAILHLASTSHSHFGLASSWADRYARKDIQKIHELEATGEIPTVGASSRTGLSILCKRAAGICSVCNNRYVCNEPWTNLQVCDGCEPFYFPKISAQQLRQLYVFTPLGMEMTRGQKFEGRLISGVRYPSPGDKSRELGEKIFGPLYRWKDLQELISKKYLVGKREYGVGGSRERRSYRGEEYGYFCAPDETADANDWWPQALLWVKACAAWDLRLAPKSRNGLRPCMADMLVFREFRYRFDPTWCPKRTLQRELDDYFQCAGCWTDSKLWDKRPWRICNFPFQPRCLATSPLTSGAEVSQMWNELASYQNRCATVRAALKAFPCILQAPHFWGNFDLDEEGVGPKGAALLAAQAKLSWQGAPGRSFECLLLRLPNEMIEVRCLNLLGNCTNDVLESIPKSSKIDKVTGDPGGVYDYSQIETDI